MTGPNAGRAALDIVGDTSKFAGQVEADLNQALRRVKLDPRPLANQLNTIVGKAVTDASHEFDKLDDSARNVFREISDAADRGFDSVTADARDAGDDIAHQIAAAGEKAESSLEEVGDRSKREFDRVERNARDAGSNIGATFKRLAGTLAAAFAAIQVGRFFLQAAQDAEDLGSAIANTQQIIKSTRGAADLLATDIREISRQLSLKIGVDSVEVQNAANILLTFKGVAGKTFTQALGLAADLSAVLGSDLNGAVLQLGKALNDPVLGVTALARAGVQFTTQQKDQIKALVGNNNLLGAQAIILKEVQSQVGGVAIAGADTTDKLKVAFKDLKREAGEALIGFIDDSGPQMIGILEKLGPVVGRVGGVIADALSAALPIIDVLATSFRDNFAQLAPAIEPLAKILEAVLALLPKLVPILVQIGQTLLPPLADILGTVAAALLPIIDLVLKLAASILTALAPALGPIGVLLNAVAKVIGDALLAVLPPLITIVLKLLDALLPLVPVFLDVLTALLPLAQPIVDVVLALLPLIDALVPLIALAAQLVGLFGSLLQPIIKLVSALVSLLVSKAVAPLLNLIAKALVFVLQPVVKVVEWVGKLGDLLDGIEWGKVGAAIGGAFASAWHAVQDFFVGLGRWFADLPGNIGHFLTELPAVIGRALAAAFDAGLKAVGVGLGLILAAIITLPKLIINALLALPGLLADFFGFLWDSVVAAFHQGIDLAVFALTELPAKALGAVLRFNQVMRDGFISAMKAVGRAVADGVSAVLSFFGSLPGRIVGLGPKMLAAGKSLIKGFFDGLSAVGGFLGDVGSAVLRGLKAGLNHVIRAINSGIASVDDALPFVKLPRLPELASGGLTTDTGLALLHPRELVLPLEDRRAVDLLGQALAEADAGLRATGVIPPAEPGDIHIRVFVGTRELTDIVDVQIDERNRDLRRRVTAGSGRSR